MTWRWARGVVRDLVRSTAFAVVVCAAVLTVHDKLNPVPEPVRPAPSTFTPAPPIAEEQLP